MKSTRNWIVLVFALAFGFQQNYPGTVVGRSGQACYPTNFRHVDASPTMSVYGNSIENIDRVTTGVSGLRVVIVAKFNGQQNNSGPYPGKGRVDLLITTSNAPPGLAEIQLINDPDFGLGGETFTFNISIIPPPTVTGASSPTPAGPFNNITVTLTGTGLAGPKDPASATIVKNDNLIPFITVNTDANIQSVRILSSSSTSLQAQIFFTALVQDATVELALQTDGNVICVPLITPIKTRVRVRSSDIRNHVKRITFPNGNTFDNNSIGTILVNLQFPAPQRDGTTAILAGRKYEGNKTVFFKLVPANAFTGVPNGTPINTAGFTVLEANVGNDVIPIRFKVADCLGGQPGTTSTAKIQTWMHSPGSTLPPTFVETTFQVRCTQ